MGREAKSAAGTRINRARAGSLSTLLCVAAALPSVASAGPADKVYSPIVVFGETEIELRGGYRDFGDEGGERAFVLDIGRAFTPRWFTELVAEYSGESGEGGGLEALEWENIIQLTEQGKYAVDVGLFAEVEWTRDADAPQELKLGPMFQKDIGASTANLNLLFERQFGSGAGDDIELVYQAQWRRRGNPAHEFGVQAFGELGPIDDLGDAAQHSVGPAIFGAARLGVRNRIAWNAAVLGGLTDESPDATVRFEVEWEIY